MSTGFRLVAFACLAAAVVDASMEFSGTATEVTVAADVSALLVTTPPTLANIVERQRIDQLPLNGRFFQNLIALTTPGIEGGAGNGRVYGQNLRTRLRESKASASAID